MKAIILVFLLTIGLSANCEYYADMYNQSTAIINTMIVDNDEAAIEAEVYMREYYLYTTEEYCNNSSYYRTLRELEKDGI
tara:strand:+ start:897 stop:1136 length:240 start_codon:yes stop_codon:yes gene_type:complete